MRPAVGLTALALAFTAFTVSPPPAAALDSLEPIPSLLPPSHLTHEARARARALNAFHLKSHDGKSQRYKFAGRKVTFLKYNHATEVYGRDVVLKFRMPGKRGTWMRFELEF